MERNRDTHGAEIDGPTNPSAMGRAAQPAGTASQGTGGRARARLVSGWRFTRHLLEMVLAMMVGMGVFGLVLAVVGEPPGYANLLVRYGVMGVFMAAPMVAWMRYRGHSWRDGGEMTAAMLVPMFAVVMPFGLGVVEETSGQSGHALMMLAHVAMVGGMVALMIYRRDRYT